MTFRQAIILSAALALGTAAGCSERAIVTGKLVRRDGQPLVGARVIATSPETGKSAYGTTDDEGRFQLGVAEAGDGVPPGDYEVVIVEERGDPDHRRPPTIAVKYRKAETSGLALSVEAGESTELNATLDPQ